MKIESRVDGDTFVILARIYKGESKVLTVTITDPNPEPFQIAIALELLASMVREVA